MTQFKSKKDGSHYPLKGGVRSYPVRKVEDTAAYHKLKFVKREDLDDFEQMTYDKAIKTSNHDHVLQVIINTVEGDYSQLSSKLSKIAHEEDKELGVKN